MKRFWTIFPCFGLVTLSWGTSILPVSDSLFSEGKYALALEKYEDILSQGKAHRRHYYQQALSYARSGHYRVATRLFLMYLGQYPRDADARLTLGNLYRWQGQLDNAKNQYRMVLKISPQYGDAALALGSLHLIEGEWRAARIILNNLKKTTPTHPGWRQLWERLNLVSRPGVASDYMYSSEEEWDYALDKYAVEIEQAFFQIHGGVPWNAEHQSKVRFETGTILEKNLSSRRRNYTLGKNSGFFSHIFGFDSLWSLTAGAGVSSYGDKYNGLYRLGEEQTIVNLSASLRYKKGPLRLTSGYFRGENVIKIYTKEKVRLLKVEESFLAYRIVLGKPWGISAVTRYADYEMGNTRTDLECGLDFRSLRLKGVSARAMWLYSDFKKDVPHYYAFDYRNKIQGRIGWEGRIYKIFFGLIKARAHWDGVEETVNPGEKHIDSVIVRREFITFGGLEVTAGLSCSFRSRFFAECQWRLYRNTRHYRAEGLKINARFVF